MSKKQSRAFAATSGAIRMRCLINLGGLIEPARQTFVICSPTSSKSPKKKQSRERKEITLELDDVSGNAPKGLIAQTIDVLRVANRRKQATQVMWLNQEYGIAQPQTFSIQPGSEVLIPMKELGGTLHQLIELHPEAEGRATSKTFTILCHDFPYIGVTDDDGNVNIANVPLGKVEITYFEWSDMIEAFQFTGNGTFISSTNGTFIVNLDGNVDLGNVVAQIGLE